jgi:hypothetical protein
MQLCEENFVCTRYFTNDKLVLQYNINNAAFYANTTLNHPNIYHYLKYIYLFWLITVVPFKIDLKSFPRSAFVFINTRYQHDDSLKKDRYF